MKHVESLIRFAMVTAMLMPAASQVSADELEKLSDGEASIGFRYRFEDVDQNGMSEDAAASTLRTRFTWKSGQVDRFKIGIEADYVSVIGSEKYNSTANGKAQYPIVPDPEGFDLNRAYVSYQGDRANADFGRQRILHGSQRFVGGVGWRQNEQTYDALRLRPKFAEWSIDYAYVWNVNRIFGPDDGVQPADWHGNSHFVTAGRPISEDHKIELFGYLLDFENANGPVNSSSTWGLGYKGKVGIASLAATIATQSDYADSPRDYSAKFYSVQADIPVKPVTLTLGYEVLGSDEGVAAFMTPLATLHKFQGWTDKFLVTPATGIEDTWLGVKGKVKDIGWNLMWHDFGADEGSADYGTELNFVVNYAVTKHIKVQFKAADYEAEDFSTDTTKYWLTTMVNF